MISPQRNERKRNSSQKKYYVNVSIPSKLVDLVDKIWKTSKKEYCSRAEFVLEAIREKIEREK